MALVASLPAQAPPAAPAAPLAFDVASIKESAPVTPAMVQAGKIHVGMKIDGAHVDIGNFSLLQLICKAYDVKTYQVQGPGWMTPVAGPRFDIIANMPHGATKDDVPKMLQALLAERFKLELHKDTKERPVYALVVAKTGIKMKESAAAAAADVEGPGVSGSNQATIQQGKNGAVINDGQGHQQKMTMSPDGKSMHLEITNADMPLLAEGLSPLVDRPIVDMTELKGKYDVAIELSMQDMMNAARNAGAAVPPAGGGAASDHPADAASDPGTGSIFRAIQELGLKLEPRKLPLTFLVIDKVEKTPTEN